VSGPIPFNHIEQSRQIPKQTKRKTPIKSDPRDRRSRKLPFFTAPHDLAKLKGRKGYYRIRIGELRIIFKVDKEPKKIYIEEIGYRKKIYT
jgi:mRNA-degrading endonuclease RelE of RelBE toxin-antitoxin system